MIKRIKGANAATRLIFSFAVIIAIFIVYVILSNFFRTQIINRYKHNNDFIMARSEMISDFHQEFTEMRRFLRASFMSPSWRAATDEETWREYEDNLTYTYGRLSRLSEAYIASVNADTVFPPVPGDRRLELIEEIMSDVTDVYETLRDNFFIGSEMNFIYVDIVTDATAADTAIRELRQILADNHEASLVDMEDIESMALFLTVIAVVAGFVVSVLLAVSMIKSVRAYIKEMINTLSETQRRELEASERGHQMFEATPLLVGVWNKSLEMIEINTYAMKMLGHESPDEYIHSDFFFENFTPPTQPCGTPSQKFMQKSLAEVFKHGSHSFKYTMKTIYGRIIYTEIKGELMMVGDEMAVITYAADITELKESLDKVTAFEERNKLMLDSNPSACYLVDEYFSILNCNKAAVELFNFANKEEALLKSKEIFMGRGFERFRIYFSGALNSGFSLFLWDLDKPDGTVAPCEVTLVRLPLDEKQVIAVYLKDLTAFMQMREQEEKAKAAEEHSNAKSRFLAAMSHEIRTPIATVLGIAEIQLQNPALTPELLKVFSRIYDSASVLLHIINDLLDISKIEAGKMELIVTEYETSSLVMDTVQVQIAYVGSKPVEFKVEADEDMPAYLLGDEIRIKQILYNLLSNAFKYTDEGIVKLTMRCDYPNGNRSDGEPCDLHITVEDTGRGMTPEQVESLQEEYLRFHDRTDPSIEGTGLGMSIVSNLVTLMGGTINVESVPDRGTTVTIRIPQMISGGEKLGREAADNLGKLDFSELFGIKKKNFNPEPMPYGSVLVVDDTEANLYVAKGLMELYKLKVETVTGGIDAVNKINAGEVYDIIFMDHMMPGMNGVDATKLIRHLGYDGPVVALTANALIGTPEEFTRNGFDGFVSKPIQTAQLNATLNKFIRDKQPPEVIAEANKAAAAKETQSMDRYLQDDGFFKTLLTDFVETQQDIMPEILAAYANSDFEQAHLLAHTLKSVAGLIGESDLANAAGRVEKNFRAQMNSTELVASLEKELNTTIEKINKKIKGDVFNV